MRSVSFLVLVLLAASGCQQHPPGQCDTHSDCAPGRECSSGVCIPFVTAGRVGDRCVREAECVEWADCSGEVCTLSPGRCDGAQGCESWQTCGGANVCVPSPGNCGAEADCASWQDCGADHVCRVAPGFCGVDGDCQSWQACGASHVCETAAGRCAIDGDCAAWMDCGADHFCAVTPGMCGYPGDCAAWQVCGADYTCQLAPNGCADEAGCATWQDCVSYRCATGVGYCAVDADCLAWQDCNPTSHLCELTPGMCATQADCTAVEQCDATNHCAVLPGRCNDAADCGRWATCDAGNHCVVGPTEVLFWGTVEAPYCGRSAVAPVADPAGLQVGFACGRFGGGMISPSGRIVYETMNALGNFELRTFVPDALSWNATTGRWEYPTSPEANDPLAIETPVCPDTWFYWAMQAGTGALAYGCPNVASRYDYYDASSSLVPGLVGVSVLSWNANGYKLVIRGTAYEIVDPAGASTPVTGLPAVELVAWRATATGFRVATELPVLERWAISEAGVAIDEGSYAAPAAGVDLTYSKVMDGEGTLYRLGADSATGLIGLVVRMPLAPGVSSIVYTEADAPANANDFWGASFNPYLLLYNGDLVTTP